MQIKKKWRFKDGKLLKLTLNNAANMDVYKDRNCDA